MNTRKILSLALRVVAAFLLIQTLYFKFTAQPESVYIFSKLGIEPWGRIGSGVAELIASVLMLIPSTITLGALMAAGIMAGALFSHLTVLGIEVEGDGGLLFAYALIVFLASVSLLFMHSDQLISYKKKLIR